MTIEITAKSKKFVPVADRVKRVQNSTAKLKKMVVKTAGTIRRVNQSKGNPRLKMMRIKKLKALQTYLQSAIMYNNTRIKEMKSPS